MIEENKKDKLK